MTNHSHHVRRELHIAGLTAVFGLVSCAAHNEMSAPSSAAPAGVSPETYRQFDFWVGDWVVTDAIGRTMGASHVERAENGFAIIEYWTSARGGTGRSINYVDPAEGRWKQNWVSGRGNVVSYSGGFDDGAMRFQGRSTVADGTTELARAVFTPGPDGTVHQFIEHSSDAGATWYVYFDGTYRKRPSFDGPTGENPQR